MDQKESNRLQLHEFLCGILESRNCYFSPPSNISMKYPCIIYEEDTNSVRHADDTRYFRKKRYVLTVIDEDPDSKIPEILYHSSLKYLNQDRTYIVDGLNHFVFTIYY